MAIPSSFTILSILRCFEYTAISTIARSMRVRELAPPLAVAALLYGCTFACFWQVSWSGLVSLWGGQERLGFAIACASTLELVFWLTQLMLLLVERTPELYARWAIRKPQPYPDAELLSRCLVDIAVGHVLRPALLWLAFPLYRWCGCSFDDETPSFLEVALHLAFAVIVDDTVFYWFHRTLHTPSFYSAIHKQHHKFRHTVGLATEFSHPIEDLGNSLATMAGPLLLGSHGSVVCGYACIKLWQSIDAHSSLVLPFPLSPWNLFFGMDCSGAHDFHHSHNVGNFGGYFIFWDWLCGTDAAYRRHLSTNKRA